MVLVYSCIFLTQINDVAEQLHCSLHVKELKVTTTKLEKQT